MIFARFCGRCKHLESMSPTVGRVMGLVVDVRMLLSTWELTQIFELPAVTTMGSITKRDPTFPEPALRFGKNNYYSLWWWPLVLEWSRSTGRLTPNMDKAPTAPPPPRLVDVDHIVSSHEIAERLGYRSIAAFSSVRSQAESRPAPYTFPRPVHEFGKNQVYKLWLWPEVLAWAYATNRIRLQGPRSEK